MASGVHTLRKICKAKNGHPGVLPSGARTLAKGGEQGREPMRGRGEANSPLISVGMLHYIERYARAAAAAKV